MNTLFCPSMMCANAGNLQNELENLESAGADILHLDVMDGKYVPNFAMGFQDISYLAAHASKPCDLHLMVTNPVEYIPLFAQTGVKIIYIHPEAGFHPVRTLQNIERLGIAPGLAISPETSVESIRPLLGLIKYLLVMTVSPGFAGQQYLSFVNEKIRRLSALKSEYKYSIILDGACSESIIREHIHAGVDGFVLGTSVLFGQPECYADILNRLHNIKS